MSFARFLDIFTTFGDLGRRQSWLLDDKPGDCVPCDISPDFLLVDRLKSHYHLTSVGWFMVGP
jgi:hypothetical protein